MVMTDGPIFYQTDSFFAGKHLFLFMTENSFLALIHESQQLAN